MCEPHHSIVQYPINDDQGDNTTRLQWGLKKIFDWGKRIGSFFHFSKLGSGHTESIEWAATKDIYLPRDTRYEANWWDRTVHLDGGFNGYTCEKESALQYAKEYANVVAIGDLQRFRQFFETSIKQTDKSVSYFHRFIEDMLNKTGRDQANAQLRRIWGNWVKAPKDKVASLLLGYTRKRNLLVPAWADDSRLWTA